MFTTRLPDELDRKITELARKKGVSKNSLIVYELWKLFESEELKENKNERTGKQH